MARKSAMKQAFSSDLGRRKAVRVSVVGVGLDNIRSPVVMQKLGSWCPSIRGGGRTAP